MDSEITITDANFKSEVLDSDIPVLIDFWAEWCAPCRVSAPFVEQIAATYEGKIKVGKINVDQAPDIAAKYNVISIPTFMVFTKGNVARSRVGGGTKQALEDLIKDFIF